MVIKDFNDDCEDECWMMSQVWMMMLMLMMMILIDEYTIMTSAIGDEWGCRLINGAWWMMNDKWYIMDDEWWLNMMMIMMHQWMVDRL